MQIPARHCNLKITPLAACVQSQQPLQISHCQAPGALLKIWVIRVPCRSIWSGRKLPDSTPARLQHFRLQTFAAAYRLAGLHMPALCQTWKWSIETWSMCRSHVAVISMLLSVDSGMMVDRQELQQAGNSVIIRTGKLSCK